jgi:K+/H+ antiporter YhaU regulatory subunit KhtT
MLTLIIKERGHMIDLPNMAPFRTPAEIDVSKIPLNVLILKMKAYNINEYQIISETGGKKIVYKKDDIEKKKIKESHQEKKKEIDQVAALTKRFNRLEELLVTLAEGTKTNQDLEQINKKIDKLTGQVSDIKVLKEVVVQGTDKQKDKDDDIYEPDTFIPQIETGGMKIQSGEHKSMKREGDVDDAADLLSQLTKKK